MFPLFLDAGSATYGAKKYAFIDYADLFAHYTKI